MSASPQHYHVRAQSLQLSSRHLVVPSMPSEIDATTGTCPSVHHPASPSFRPFDDASRFPTAREPVRQQTNTHPDIKREADNKQTGAGIAAPSLPQGSLHPATGSLSPFGRKLGQKRSAAGVVKPSADMRRETGSSGVERRRSRSISSLPHGSRIAALSVHLRTRLSYAAAKVEKSRQSSETQAQLPLEFLTHDSSASSPNMEPSVQVERSPEPFGGAGHRLMELGSPDGTTVSAPDPPRFSSLHDHTRASPVARSDNLSPFSLNDDLHNLQRSRGIPSAPKLAPPADIIPSSGKPRRRPNPNEAVHTHPFAPLSNHRRYHSQHDLRASQSGTQLETVLVPGTPPLGPSAFTSTPYNGTSSQQSQSQNTSMEQDAIETLLFMSSPGNTGYRSNSQNSQNKLNPIRNNIPASIGIAPGASWSHHSQFDTNSSQSTQLSAPRGPVDGPEAHAGDEIDRMLDQMDSDSEDERNVVPQSAIKASVPIDTSHGDNGLSG
ncbi:hypothetical protein BDV59DRAFT_53946 [Aspergillus ambiguus]|uniref:uncharacterized protein n=1 Tax=Aspergillus ambiguus TaxID=176160 RepID=UPI003CCCFA76